MMKPVGGTDEQPDWVSKSNVIEDNTRWHVEKTGMTPVHTLQREDSRSPCEGKASRTTHSE